jgi:hypothetical protein
MKTQKIAKIRKTRNSAQVGDTLIDEPQHLKIEDCEQWRVVIFSHPETSDLSNKSRKIQASLFSLETKIAILFWVM